MERSFRLALARQRDHFRSHVRAVRALQLAGEPVRCEREAEHLEAQLGAQLLRQRAFCAVVVGLRGQVSVLTKRSAVRGEPVGRQEGGQAHALDGDAESGRFLEELAR